MASLYAFEPLAANAKKGAVPSTVTSARPSAGSGKAPPVIFSRETRANLEFMIEAKFSPADAAELRPGQPVDVELPCLR